MGPAFPEPDLYKPNGFDGAYRQSAPARSQASPSASPAGPSALHGARLFRESPYDPQPVPKVEPVPGGAYGGEQRDIAAHAHLQQPLAQDIKPGRITGPVKVLAAIAEQWRLTDAELAKLLDMEQATEARSAADVRSLLAGFLTLRGRDRKDRVRHLFSIHEALAQTLPEEGATDRWLRSGHAELQGRSPMQIMLEGSMESLLSVRDYVERWVGR